jgi:predicted nucleic acid-binding protein
MERMLDDELAARAARHYRTMRERGTTIYKTIDLIIATFCIERGHQLLHEDRDFDRIAAHLNLQTM